MASISRYIYSNCSTLAVGCILYNDNALTSVIASKFIKITSGGISKNYATNASGAITSITDCTWSSTQTYAPVFTGTKNDCVGGSCSVSGSTVNLNDGNPVNAYSTSGSYTSYISQADADAQALAIAISLFESGKQARVNQLGFCTWTYNSGSGSYSQTYTRNNCAGNCYGLTWTTSSTKSNYSASSTVSCQAAINAANTAAYNAAVAEVQANGQTNANNNAGCCCWNLEYYCSGCDYRSRERNSCDSSTRNDTLVASNSCNCDQSCAGTYWSYYCSDTTRMRELRYNCNGAYAGTTEVYATCDQTNCGASTAPLYTAQNYTTCYDCYNAPVFRDTRGVCSPTNGQYYIENQAGNKVLVGTQPSGTPCNTNSSCVDTGNAYCSGPNWVINQTQGNSCSTASCGVRVIEYNSQSNGCYTPPPSCYTYNIIRFTTTGNVTGTYTTCSGGSSTFNFTRAEGTTGFVGSVCAQQGTVSVNSGNGQVQTGSTCST